MTCKRIQHALEKEQAVVAADLETQRRTMDKLSGLRVCLSLNSNTYLGHSYQTSKKSNLE